VRVDEGVGQLFGGSGTGLKVLFDSKFRCCKGHNILIVYMKLYSNITFLFSGAEGGGVLRLRARLQSGQRQEALPRHGDRNKKGKREESFIIGFAVCVPVKSGGFGSNKMLKGEIFMIGVAVCISVKSGGFGSNNKMLKGESFMIGVSVSLR